MQEHTKIYYDYYGYNEGDFIPCEVDGRIAVDIHHIEYRSKFGSKNKAAQNSIRNLIALCRDCHNKAHKNILNKEYLKYKHEITL